jgi:hypothetical protein
MKQTVQKKKKKKRKKKKKKSAKTGQFCRGTGKQDLDANYMKRLVHK